MFKLQQNVIQEFPLKIIFFAALQLCIMQTRGELKCVSGTRKLQIAPQRKLKLL